MEKSTVKKMTHSEKMAFAVNELEKAKKKLLKLTESRILEIGRLAEKHGLLDVDNQAFDDAFRKISSDLKK